MLSRPRLPIVVFIGYVGAGKSTQMGYVASSMAQKGFDVKCTVVAPNLLMSRAFYPILRRILRSRKILCSQFDRFLQMVDLLLNTVLILPLLSLFKVSLWRKLGKLVFVEEYLIGSIVNYLHVSRISSIRWDAPRFLVHLLLRLIPIDDVIVVMLSASYSTLRIHWDRRGGRSEYISYIRSQRIVFETFRKSLRNNLISIDVDNKSISQVSQEIQDQLTRALNHFSRNKQH